MTTCPLRRKLTEHGSRWHVDHASAKKNAMRALLACALLVAGAGATAAWAQTQNYPASPYLSAPNTQPSPYYGSSSSRSQGQSRGYLNPNPYDPNSVYGAGAPYRPDRLRNPSGTGGLNR